MIVEMSPWRRAEPTILGLLCCVKPYYYQDLNYIKFDTAKIKAISQFTGKDINGARVKMIAVYMDSSWGCSFVFDQDSFNSNMPADWVLK